MAKEKTPVTAAVRVLRAEKVAFSDHLYTYEEKGVLPQNLWVNVRSWRSDQLPCC